MTGLAAGKVCSECELEFTSRYKQAKTCSKECSLSRQKQASIVRSREWVKNNYLVHMANMHEYRSKNRIMLRQKAAKYQSEHKSEYAASGMAYRASHKIDAKAYQSNWYIGNSDISKHRSKQRRARMRANEAFQVTKRDISRLLNRCRYECVYCGESLQDSYHLDHVLPVSRGGGHGIGNLAASCPPCNLSKHASLLSEWRYKSIRGVQVFSGHCTP